MSINASMTKGDFRFQTVAENDFNQIIHGKMFQYPVANKQTFTRKISKTFTVGKGEFVQEDKLS